MNSEEKMGQSAPGKNEKLKSFSTSSLAGAAFGLVVGVVFVLIGAVDLPPLLFIGGLSFITAAFSGLSGLLGSYLDDMLLKVGINNSLLRMTIISLMVITITFTLAIVLFNNLSFEEIVPAFEQYGPPGMFLGFIFAILVAVISYRMETVQQKLRLLEIENRYLAELAEKDHLLQEAARNLAVTEERNSMARELHDSISQGIHGIVFSLHSLRRQLSGNSNADEIINHLEETTQATLKELRRLTMELTPSPLEDNSLSEALQLHSDLFSRRQQIKVSLDLQYSGKMTPEQEVAAYRIVQEALTNIQKHSEASEAKITLKDEEGHTLLLISDNGRGFDLKTAKTGHGLANMATRARQNNGEFSLSSQPGKGATIKVLFLFSSSHI